MITLILCAVLAIFIGDALYARARIRLRMRAAQAASKRPSHQLTGRTGSGGWRSLNEEAAEQREPESGSPFGKIGQIVSGNNGQRPRR